MYFQTTAANSLTSGMPSHDSNTDLEYLFKPQKIGSHLVEVNKSVKSYLMDKCNICHESFCTQKPISEFSCGHIIHAECLINMLQTNEGESMCSYCHKNNPNFKNKTIIVENWLNSKIKSCKNDGCFYNTKLYVNPDTNKPDCPFPLSCFDPMDKTSIGFLHRYGRVLYHVIIESITQLNFTFKNHELRGITEDEEAHLRANFNGYHDLTSISKRIDNEFHEIREIVKFTSSTQAIDTTCKEKLNKISNKLEQTLKDSNLIQDSLIELRSLIEQQSGFDKKNHPSGFAKNGLKYISKKLNYEMIPGLSSMSENEINILINFSSRFGDMTITLASSTLNDSKKSIFESFDGVRKIIKYAPFETRAAYFHPAIFDRDSSLYFKRPFNYIEDKINIVSKTHTHILYISLSRVVNDSQDDFNHEALKAALEEQSLDYNSLNSHFE